MDLSQFENLGSLLTPTNTANNGVIDLSLIKEDPNQPRTIFDPESLKELSDTIKQRGVKSPISVRENGDGSYTINHGARRYRASLMAGLTHIPAIIDNDYTSIDQVIENIQRDNLEPMDIARFIDKEIQTGKKRGEIAQELGKSNSWVSMYAKLAQAPEIIKEKIDQGSFGKDITAISEVIKLYEKEPQKTIDFLNENEDITRSKVKEYFDSDFYLPDEIALDDEEKSKQKAHEQQSKDQIETESNEIDNDPAEPLDTDNQTEQVGRIRSIRSIVFVYKNKEIAIEDTIVNDLGEIERVIVNDGSKSFKIKVAELKVKHIIFEE